MNRRSALLSTLSLALLASFSGLVAAANPKEIRVDYAYYSPPSLVLKKFGWLEQEFKADQVPVKWIFSQGSNRSLELINSGSADFGSTAGLAAVLSRANGNPVKGVYIYERPEWAALVVAKDSPIKSIKSIKSIKDLKGKKVAATKGTDPYLFLLRALHTEGLSKKDIEHVALQHPDGRVAIELPVAKLQLTRNDFTNPVPGAEHIKALKAAGPLLVEEDLVKKGVNVHKVIDELVDPSFAKAVIK